MKMNQRQKIAIGIGLLVVTVILGIESGRQPPTPSATPSVFIGAPAATPTPSLSVRPSAVPVSTQTAILNAINARRSAAGVAHLTVNSKLQSLAQAHAADMVARGYFSHTDPDGVTFQNRMTTGGYVSGVTAENIGVTSGATVQIVTSWMNSEGHRINMLNRQYVASGIGVASGTYNGAPAVFVVAIFGASK